MSEREMLQFPPDFLWGASTSAHQVEGGTDNDWTEWEKTHAEKLAHNATAGHDYGNGRGTVPNWPLVAHEAKNPDNYISGHAVGHWESWRDDIDLAKSLGLNALRYSVEWSRVEPSPETVNGEALAHYADVTAYCLDNGIQPFITLHHFTNPKWIAEKGGWEKKEIVERFTNYTQTVTEAMPADGLNWLVINEPEVYAGMGYVMGMWPPNKHNPRKYLSVTKNMAEAHKHNYDLIKERDETAEVSSAVNNIHFDPRPGPLKIANEGLAKAARKLLNHRFHEATMDHQDFIGLNHYMHCVVNGGIFKNDRANEPRSDLGWYLNPESIYHVLSDLKRYNKPIVITENGLADSADRHRAWFITETLRNVHKAMREGADVKGYLHWSLLDNFEWDKGSWPHFGLFAVDHATMQRTKRASAATYATIVKQNSLPAE